MKIFSFMRKPLKPILYGALLTLLCTVALIFSLQYQTDRQTLDTWLDNYAYIGTICPDIEGPAIFTPLPEETKVLLQEADTITSLHSMQTYAAKLTDGNIVPDHMMTLDQLQQRYFLHAKVTGHMSMDAPAGLKYDYYTVQLIKEWGSDKTGDWAFHVSMLRLEDEPSWNIGDEVFFTSGYVLKNGAVIVVEFELYTPAAWEALTGFAPTSVFMQNPYLILKEGEGDAEIQKFLDDTGMAPLYEKFCQLDGNLSVRAISDFYALPKTASDRLYITDGRSFTEEDFGQKVCMISQNLATRNRYVLGDIVTLSIADTSYSLGGWENGNPMPDDELITSYGQPEAYEIIGIYNQIGRDAFDPLYYSHTDIFIPQNQVSDVLALPYAFSFRVLGVDYDEFKETTLPRLESSGCAVRLADIGWEDVEDAYYAMELRCTLMFWCAVLAFTVATIVFTTLLFLHLRKEYGLCRLMGAYRHEAQQVYFAAVSVIAIPALAFAGIFGQVIVQHILQNDLEGNILLFISLPIALLIAICLLLLLLLHFSERGSLRKIIM